ncbi:MAG: DUF4350 domain-containing protein [Firmicutes bacterium]|nr:DUF4350 domain-containing protein [Bacillota bacterium]
MDRWNRWTVGLAVCVFLFLFLGYLVVKPAAVEYPPYLSVSPAPDGTKALALLLKEKRQEVREWKQAWRFLPKGENQVMVAIEPYGLKKEDRDAVLEWVRQGNHLVLFEDDPRDWGNGISTVGINGHQAGKRVIEARGWAADQELAAQVDTPRRLYPGQGDRVLLADSQGALASRYGIGRGSVTVFLTPGWVTNRAILEDSHFALVWPVLNQEWDTVWLDEYHHGRQSDPPLLAVYPGWLVAAGAQLLLGLALWLWWKGKRFGPVYTPRDWVVRRGDETLVAVAGWYERRGLCRDALAHQYGYLRQLFRLRWGMAAEATDQEIVGMAEANWGSERADRLRALFRRQEEVMRGGRYGVKDFLADSREIDGFIKKLEEE